MRLNEFSPFLLTVVQEPLITQGYNAFISSTRYDFTFWLIIWGSLIVLNQLLSDDWFSILHLEAGGLSYKHNSFIETLQVNLILGFSQLVLVLLRLNFHLLNKFHC